MKKKTSSNRRPELSYYNLFWVFIIGSVIGYVLETAFCFVTTGTIQSRKGLLYGPFCQVYGFGAVVMIVLLTPLSQKPSRLFIGGAIVGGLFEFVCSFLQERWFGSVSWDYSDDPLSLLGGRTSIPFMLCWGILCLWFMRSVYPHMDRAIQRIPQGFGKKAVAILTIFMAINIGLSSAAVYRWQQRIHQQPATTEYEAFLDEQYPDEVMQTIYPGMISTTPVSGHIAP